LTKIYQLVEMNFSVVTKTWNRAQNEFTTSPAKYTSLDRALYLVIHIYPIVKLLLSFAKFHTVPARRDHCIGHMQTHQ